MLEEIKQYGETNATVNFRKEPSRDAKRAASNVKSGTRVYVMSLVQPNGSDENWYSILLEGNGCFVMAEYVDITGAKADVTVYYVDENGDTLKKTTLSLTEGEHSVEPDISVIPEGYALTDTEAVTVNVLGEGNAEPSEIRFSAAKLVPITATVRMRYIDSATGEEMNSASEDFLPGSYSVSANSRLIPKGYRLDTEEPVTLNVDEDGHADPEEICFYVHSIESEPASAQVTVRYVDRESGSVVSEITEKYEAGSYSVTPDASGIEGYSLVDTEPVALLVDENGNAEPNTILFRIQAEEQESEITVLREINQYGYTSSAKVNLRAKPTLKGELVDHIPEKGTQLFVYSLVCINGSDETWYQVAYHDKICYALRELIAIEGEEPVSAEITVDYVDQDSGESIYSKKLTLWEGNTTVAPEDGLPEGYELADASPITVTVDAQGEATPDAVRFQVKKLSQEEPEEEKEYKLLESIERHGVTNKTSVNVRSKPTQNSKAIVRINQKGTEVYVYNLVCMNGSEEGWYEISYNDKEGFILSDLITVEEAPQPATAEVTVSYVDQDSSAIVLTKTLTLTEGETVISPVDELPEAYTLEDASPVTVTVDADGNAQPGSVVFPVRLIPVVPATAELSVRYYDSSSGELLANPSLTLTEGVNQLAPDESLLPGYEITNPDPVEVTVSSDGKAIPSTVSFFARQLPVSVPIYYTEAESGGVLLSDSVEISSGSNSISPVSGLVSGYELVDTAPVTVVLSKDGSVSPESVSFRMKKIEPKEAVITLKQVDIYGNNLADPSEISLTEGSYQAADFFPGDMEGYNYASVTPDSFTVDASGNVSPSSVLSFLYVEKPAVSASVRFRYECKGKKIVSPITQELEEGEHDASEYRMEFEGYTLQSVSAETIVVDSQGKATPDEVTFTYTKNKTEVEVPIYYVDSIGETLNQTSVSLKAGTHTVSPDENEVPAGYLLSQYATPVQVTVSSELTALPSQIVFACYSDDVSATLKLRYIDSTTGSLIATETRSLVPGYYDSIEPDDDIPAEYGDYTPTDIVYDYEVTVSENGSISPSSLNFYYEPKESSTYQGYLLTTDDAVLRSSAKATGGIVQNLPEETLLWSNGQADVNGISWYSVQTVLGSSYSGWISESDVEKITSSEAAAIIKEYEEAQEPEQNPGYYITIVNNAPLRSYPYTYASASFLDMGSVVYVTAQEYDDNGYLWHEAVYDGKTGYIRDGQIRKMTTAEVNKYKKGLLNPTATPAPVSTYSPQNPSSYGYVSSSSVNFRSSPNSSSTRISVIKQYGMALILDEKDVDGVTWYQINYNGKTGWVCGDYFHAMSMSEFNAFLSSSKYEQGRKNNNISTTVTATPSSNTSDATPTQGNVESVEDWNVGTWTNPTGSTSTYVPFNPYATPAPSSTPDPDATADPNAEATATPAATFVIGTMIPIDYGDAETEKTGQSSLGIILAIAGVLVLGGAVGVYFYTMSRSKKRKEAANAAVNTPGRDNADVRRATVSPAPQQSNPFEQSNNGYVHSNPYMREGAEPNEKEGYAKQLEDTLNSGHTPQSGEENPYARPAGYGDNTQYSRPQTNPYARRSETQNSFFSDENKTTQAVQQAPQQENPYARPAERTRRRPVRRDNGVNNDTNHEA